MNLFKICSFIIFYFLSRAAFSATCETFHGYQLKEKLCWDDSVKSWMSEHCLDQKKKCEAHDFLKKKKKKKITPPVAIGGQNPAALICHHLKLEVIVLQDSRNNEQSFCVFKDKSIVDTNGIEGQIK